MSVSAVLIIHALLTVNMQASEMASKALQSDELGEEEMQPAPKLLEVIMQNCRGRVDECLPLYMQARQTSF